MPEETSLVAVRAAVEAIVPPFGGLPGAADLDVQRHVVEAIEQFLPGFVDLLATLLDAYADDAVGDMAKNERGGKVFVDWSQNDRHKTTVCAYSLRAEPRPTNRGVQDARVGQFRRETRCSDLCRRNDRGVATVAGAFG